MENESSESLWGEPGDIVSDLVLDEPKAEPEAVAEAKEPDKEPEPVEAKESEPEEAQAGKTIPLPAHIAERRKYQARIEEMDAKYSKEIEELKKALPQKEPDIDPDTREAEELFRGFEHHPLAKEFKGYLDQQRETARQQAEAVALRESVARSLDDARATYADFDEIVPKAWESLKDVPGLEAIVERSPNPGDMLYGLARKMGIGATPDAPKAAQPKAPVPPSVADVANRGSGSEEDFRSSLWGTD